MGLGAQVLRLPKKEDAHFLSLIGGGAVLMTVFFLFISTANEQARFDEGIIEPNPPYVWRRRSLEKVALQTTEKSYIHADTGQVSSNSRGTLAAANERALVIYMFSRADPVHQNNLNYFLQHGISASDGCDYVVVVQGAETAQASKSLPRLPPNAQYFYANDTNCAMGLGMAAKVLSSGLVKKEEYNHYFFMSSGFRGPFIPTYALDEQHWTRYFTQKLTDRVKLVGPTISCHVPRYPEGMSQADPVPPHVQFTVLATDQVGLGLLEMDGNVMRCHSDPVEEQFYSGLGASAAILKANYSLGSFMTRYRHVDWTDKRTWECNGRKEPLAEFNYDGSSIHPYETMFVPMDTIAIENGWSYAKMAALYETWLTLQDRGDLDITTNAWVSDPWPTKLQRIAYAQSRGPGCFDNHYYLQKNADLKVIPTALELWNHFVMMGQFEGRSFRWSCEDDRKPQ